MVRAMHITGSTRRVPAIAMAAMLLALPSAVQADHRHRGWVGVYMGVNPGYYYGNPGYYYGRPRPYRYGYPRGYYALPPAYYPPAPSYATPAQTCYAGPYMCQLDAPVPTGAPCSCPTNSNTRAYGRAAD